MISIRKYLYSDAEDKSRDAGGGAAPGQAQALLRFALGVLDGIHEQTLAGEACEAIRPRLAAVREGVRPDWTVEEGLEAAEAVVRILASQKAALQKRAVSQAVEMQHIFAMLNQALIVLAEGKDRSIARLNRVQESVQRASLIEDIVALKSSLAETVRFIKSESVRTQEASAEELAKLEKEVSHAREYLGSISVELAGRAEGVGLITESLREGLPDGNLYVVAFVLDRLQAIQQRYGAAVAEEVIFRLMKDRLQPAAPGNTTFRWTGSSLVAVFRSGRDLAKLRAEVSNLNLAPLVHRIAVCNRTAVLSVKPSHLVLEGVVGSPEVLIGQVDLFAGVAR